MYTVYIWSFPQDRSLIETIIKDFSEYGKIIGSNYCYDKYGMTVCLIYDVAESAQEAARDDIKKFFNNTELACETTPPRWWKKHTPLPNTQHSIKPEIETYNMYETLDS